MSRAIYIDRPDEEHVHVYGESVELYANYDEHGSAGLALLEQAVRVMAEAFGAEVIDTAICGCCAGGGFLGSTHAANLCDFCGHPRSEHQEET